MARPWWRDLWLFIISGILLLAVIAIAGTAQKADHAATRATSAVTGVQQGRQAATAVQCAVTSAIINAGRDTITAQARMPENRFTRNLERLGYPAKRFRDQQARAAAAAYAQSISAAVSLSLGSKGRGLVNPDGTLNCLRLQAVGQTGK